DVADEGVQVPDQGLHHLLEPGRFAAVEARHDAVHQLLLPRGLLQGVVGAVGFAHGCSSGHRVVSTAGAGSAPVRAAVSRAVMFSGVTCTGFDAGAAPTARCTASGMSLSVSP